MRAAITTAALMSLIAGCDDKLGAGPPGVHISGEITYAGAREFQQAMLVVTVQSSPDAALPYAMTRIPVADVTAPIPYSLRYVPASTWYLMAVLDEAATFSAATASVGAFPNACVLVALPESRSLTVGLEDFEMLDMTVYDMDAPDPCFFAGAEP